jgi:alpha-ketoglutarate-dependent taurine dioxygenase
LLSVFNKHPLLIFKEVDSVSPREFIDFVKEFDPDHDIDALTYPDKYPQQMLQPFDQIPECKHVAPRGNTELLHFYDIPKIAIAPGEAFIDKYVWHTDILGHETKLPNVVTGFYIIEQPLIGGDTDFISGETVYEHLTAYEQIAARNLLIEINRKKFLTKTAITDYAGVNRVEPFHELIDGKTLVPMVYVPDNDRSSKSEGPSVLLLPSFFERVVGWGAEESRKWISEFMNNKVLPHRVSVQWKRGDLAVFNNRRWMHSSTPARNYIDNEDSSKRLLLQTFIPTKRSLWAMKPCKDDLYAPFHLNWVSEKDICLISLYENIRHIKLKENHIHITDKREKDRYVVQGYIQKK